MKTEKMRGNSHHSKACLSHPLDIILHTFSRDKLFSILSTCASFKKQHLMLLGSKLFSFQNQLFVKVLETTETAWKSSFSGMCTGLPSLLDG